MDTDMSPMFPLYLDMLNVGIFILDADMTVVFWNAWMEAKTGTERKKAVGCRLPELYPDIDVKKLQRKMRAVFTFGTPSFLDPVSDKFLISIPVDGFLESHFSEMRQEVTISPFNDERTFVMFTITDQTRYLETQERLAFRTRELQELTGGLERRVREEVEKSRAKDLMILQQSRLATMGEMVGNVSHQWRQPLTAISLRVQDMIDAFEFGELTEEYIRENTSSILETIDFMSSTVDDFRTFFTQEQKPSELYLWSVVEKTVRIISPSLMKHEIRLVLEKNESLPPIHSFRNELSQVVLNLISNAKEQIVERGIAGGVITVSVEVKDGRQMVHVADNAGGVPSGLLERIFDPYFTTKETGSGMGLYMARTLIRERCRGDITVENRDNGAVFTVIV